jgi:isopentenyl-diphosphate Delta-isomerase
MQEQLMILVNEQDEQIGLLPKMETHQKGLLHRAFSVFLFAQNGDMILQKRAAQKYHSPLLWTNACCSHPYPNETIVHAANRRLQEELGMQTVLQQAFTFTYNAPLDQGLTEHELDHVLVGKYNEAFGLNTDEVAEVKQLSMQDIETDLINNPQQYTVWFTIAFPKLKLWMQSTNYTI